MDGRWGDNICGAGLSRVSHWQLYHETEFYWTWVSCRKLRIHGESKSAGPWYRQEDGWALAGNCKRKRILCYAIQLCGKYERESCAAVEVAGLQNHWNSAESISTSTTWACGHLHDVSRALTPISFHSIAFLRYSFCYRQPLIVRSEQTKLIFKYYILIERTYFLFVILTSISALCQNKQQFRISMGCSCVKWETIFVHSRRSRLSSGLCR